jgi:CubicO group peptidase (beta-lactamase class C family)
VTAQLSIVRPESVGLRGEQLRRIDQHLLKHYVTPGKIAGALTLVARGGQVVHLSPLGARDRERALPMAADTLFRIYSMTKPVTSVALMMLYEEGHFQLGDAVDRLLPELRAPRVFRAGSHPAFLTDPAPQPITIRDLLTHMSGLTYGFMQRTPVDAAYRQLGIGEQPRFDGYDLEQMVHELATMPLEFAPGTAWNYSLATDVVGLLVERLSGQRLDRFFAERIFEPLGMVDTGFSVPAEKAERFASCYQRGPNKELLLQDDARQSTYLQEPTLLRGGSGLVSTAHDYFRFCSMLLNRGELEGRRILGAKTVDWMTTNHLPGGQDLAGLSVGAFSETTYDGIGFGLGFAVVSDPVKAQTMGSRGEYFWGGMASTVFWIDPAEELIVIFLTQLLPSGTFNFRGQLKSIVYPGIA